MAERLLSKEVVACAVCKARKFCTAECEIARQGRAARAAALSSKLKTKEEANMATKTTEERVFELNKRLEAALGKKGQEKVVEAVKKMIAKAVADSGKAFVVDDMGYAKPATATPKAKAAKKERTEKASTPKVKKTRICPCCGVETSGGFFVIGHDSRTKSIFRKVEADKKLKDELLNTPALKGMFAIHLANPEMAIKDVAAAWEAKAPKAAAAAA